MGKYITDELASYTEKLNYESLSDDVIKSAKLFILILSFRQWLGIKSTRILEMLLLTSIQSWVEMNKAVLCSITKSYLLLMPLF